MKKPEYFIYGDKEIQHLMENDKALGEWIKERGIIKRPVNSDIFESLIDSIIGQQISSKAHATVFSRMKDRFFITSHGLKDVSEEELQKCGISMRKASYIKGIVDAVLNTDIDLEEMKNMPDEEVIKSLIKLKGVGKWTAEMLMIFSMQRPDIVSYDDLAIRRGMMKLYKHREITPDLFKKYKKRYSPYGSVASLYLWEKSK